VFRRQSRDFFTPSKAVGKSGARRVEPAAAGGIALRQKLMSPSGAAF
jgi:hypothetical protein